MSLTVYDSLTLRLTHSFTAPTLYCDTTLWGIRSCMTELLSDIRAVQMDDPSTLPWPTEKKALSFCSSLFSPLALPPLSFSESTAAVICYTTKKSFFFSQDSLQGHILQPFLGPLEATESLVVSSHQQCPTAVQVLCSWIIGSSQRHTNWERTGLMCLVCVFVCVWRQRQMRNIAAVNYCCNIKIFTFLPELSCAWA